MEALKFTIYCCIILQAFAGGPTYISSQPSQSIAPFSPLCVSCSDVYLLATTPSNAGCNPGSNLAYGVSMIIESGVLSGVCAGFVQADFDNAVSSGNIEATIENIVFSQDGQTSAYSKS